MSVTTITISFDASSENVTTHVKAAAGSDPATVLETAMAALEAERSALDGCPMHDKAQIGITQRTIDRIKAIIAEYGRRVPIPVGLTHDVLSTFDHMAEAQERLEKELRRAGYALDEALTAINPETDEVTYARVKKWADRARAALTGDAQEAGR